MKKKLFKDRLNRVTLPKLFEYFILIHVKYALWHFAAYFPICQSAMTWGGRAKIWRLIGVKVGKNVAIGYGVYLDIGGASRIEIEDNAIITSQCLLLAHKRDMSKYMTEIELQNELPFIEGKIVIKENASIGMRTTILPNVTIGKNSVIGAMSMVSKDVPDNVMAVGSPLKIIKRFGDDI